MKYGILYHKTTKNIGDDVQAYAAERLLPHVDYLIDRESMNTFKPDEDDEPVALIMSAWYMWEKWNWPPSKYIYPLWIGFHYHDQIRGRKEGMPVRFEYINSGCGYRYMKQFMPIGCRDTYTIKTLKEQFALGEQELKEHPELDKPFEKPENPLLEKFKVEVKDEQGNDEQFSYFTGCITLTLDAPREPVKPPKPYICLVDLEQGSKIEKKIKEMIKEKGLDIEVKTFKHTVPDPLSQYTWEERKKLIDDRLSIYQNALCVLTFRLHCLLPCMAMKVPVCLVRSSFLSIRFGVFCTEEYTHRTTPNDILNGTMDYDIFNPPANKPAYLKVRENLLNTINSYVDKCEQMDKAGVKASDLKMWPFSDEEYLKWHNKTMALSLHNWRIESRLDWDKMSLMSKENAKLKKEIKDLKAKNEKLGKSAQGNKSKSLLKKLFK